METSLVLIICQTCGKEKYYLPGVAKNKKFCSSVCSTLFQTHTTTITCATCGKQVLRAAWHKNHKGKQYCNQKCQHPPQIITCEWCGKEKRISPSSKKAHNFCCRKCCRAYMGKHGLHGKMYAQIKCQCATCGKNFTRDKNAAEKGVNYCSRPCFHKAHQVRMAGSGNPAWRGGLCDYGPNWRSQAARRRRRDGHACCHCGVNQKDISYKLHVHHIVPLRTFNGDFKKSNTMSNLITLCRVCHLKEEWKTGSLSQNSKPD